MSRTQRVRSVIRWRSRGPKLSVWIRLGYNYESAKSHSRNYAKVRSVGGKGCRRDYKLCAVGFPWGRNAWFRVRCWVGGHVVSSHEQSKEVPLRKLWNNCGQILHMFSRSSQRTTEGCSLCGGRQPVEPARGSMCTNRAIRGNRTICSNTCAFSIALVYKTHLAHKSGGQVGVIYSAS